MTARERMSTLFAGIALRTVHLCAMIEILLGIQLT